MYIALIYKCYKSNFILISIIHRYAVGIYYQLFENNLGINRVTYLIFSIRTKTAVINDTDVVCVTRSITDVAKRF